MYVWKVVTRRLTPIAKFDEMLAYFYLQHSERRGEKLSIVGRPPYELDLDNNASKSNKFLWPHTFIKHYREDDLTVEWYHDNSISSRMWLWNKRLFVRKEDRLSTIYAPGPQTNTMDLLDHENCKPAGFGHVPYIDLRDQPSYIRYAKVEEKVHPAKLGGNMRNSMISRYQDASLLFPLEHPRRYHKPTGPE